jgi:hypothetical protein
MIMIHTQNQPLLWRVNMVRKKEDETDLHGRIKQQQKSTYRDAKTMVHKQHVVLKIKLSGP